MRKITRRNCYLIDTLHHDRTCIKCEKKADLHIHYKYIFPLGEGKLPMCEHCYKEFLKGEITL